MKAQRGILALLRDEHGCATSLLPIEQPGVLPDGWDCKDAIEADGWTFERVQAFFAQAVTYLDKPGDKAPAAAPVGKKIDNPVGTEGVDLGDDAGADGEMVKCGSRLVPEWLSWYYDSEKNRWNISRKTVIAALEKAPDLQGIVAYDELRNTIARREAFPWPNSKPGELKDSDPLLLGDWMSNTWGLPSVSMAALEEGIKTVASKNRYHPVREWLQAQTWDNKARVDGWLVYALGESPESLRHRPHLLEYLRLVGRFWLLGMVRRVMEPGCKFDYMPVLEGAGGLRKSTLVEVLASTEFYSDTKFDIGHGHDGQEQVQGIWCYEVAELAGMSKSEVADIKAFVSSKVDRYRVTTSWISLDMGVTHQRGDVVKVQLPARGIDMPVRIENVSMAGYGRYQVSATSYDINQYPSDATLPEGDGVVPEGVIGLLVGSTVPDGWALFGAANGRFVVGAGGALAVGAVGGSDTLASWSATTTTDGLHSGLSSVPRPQPGSRPITPYEVVPSGDKGAHAHTLTAPALDVSLSRRENVLVIKVGGGSLEIPPEVKVFGLPNTNTSASVSIENTGRILRASAANANAGSNSTGVIFDCTAAGDHTHTLASATNDTFEPSSFGGASAKYYGSSGDHVHFVSAVLSFNPKRTQICSFASAAPYTTRAGMIFMWGGSIGSIPEDFVLCDGSNGSPDMRGRFPEFAGVIPAAPGGDNTVSYIFRIDPHSHSHEGPDLPGIPAYRTLNHGNQEMHSHLSTVTSRAHMPSYYALAFIMYAPSA